MINLLLTFICSFANRIRGGLTDGLFSTNGGRVFYALFSSIMLASIHIIPVAVLLFLGVVFHWAPYQYMDNPKHDVLWMTGRGLLVTAPAGLYLYFVLGHGLLYAFSGLSMGAVYWLCNYYFKPFIIQKLNVPDHNAVAEYAFGAVTGLCWALTILR